MLSLKFIAPLGVYVGQACAPTHAGTGSSGGGAPTRAALHGAGGGFVTSRAGGTPGTACDRAAPVIHSRCGGAATTVLTQCRLLVTSTCATQATLWFDCLAVHPGAATCPQGDFGSKTRCLPEFDALETCLRSGAL